jgi:hypothetical protein
MVDELVARLHAAGYDDITAAHQAVFETSTATAPGSPPSPPEAA